MGMTLSSSASVNMVAAPRGTPLPLVVPNGERERTEIGAPSADYP
jgi:hypothetical protein